MPKGNAGPTAMHPMGDIDPIQLALRPPENETPQQRGQRMREEAEAKKVSDMIDAQINVDREELVRAKKRGDIKILLLGQSESGKSTTVKNFQIAYSPNAWKAERKTWRAVIYLNLVRSVRRILALIEESHTVPGQQTFHSGAGDDQNSIVEDDGTTNVDSHGEPIQGRARTMSKSQGKDNLNASMSNLSISGTNLGPLPTHLQELTLRLSPLGLVERALIGALSSEDPESDDFEATSLGPKDLLKATNAAKSNGKEHALSAVQWKRTLKTKISGGKDGSSIFGRKKKNRDSSSSGSNGSHRGGRPSNNNSNNTSNGREGSSIVGDGTSTISEEREGQGEGGETTIGELMDANVQDDILGTLQACQDDMIRLWKDTYVRDILRRKRFRPQDSSGFYLNDIPRLLDDNYIPTDTDVLNARLKTIGVIEHSFTFDRGSEKGVNWTIYDVGGARNQRHAWASFFDSVDAIIFLAPISAFNQVLSEDPRVNRVADSLHLFRAICANKLLANVNIVLFLNKIDILKAKLEAGIQLKKYILSYGDRPNDIDNVCKFFRQTFGSVFKDYAAPEREMYVHLTTMNDPDSARDIINNVRDMLLRKSLMASNLL